jgi:hypothetical protein
MSLANLSDCQCHLDENAIGLKSDFSFPFSSSVLNPPPPARVSLPNTFPPTGYLYPAFFFATGWFVVWFFQGSFTTVHNDN